MKTFKKHLSESSNIPVIECGIGRGNKQLEESFWEQAVPFHPQMAHDESAIPHGDINTSIEYRDNLQKNVFPHLEKTHYEFLDGHSDKHKSLSSYVADSSVLNKTLRHAHLKNLDPNNPDHFYRAMQHAYDFGDIDSNWYHDIEWHKNNGYFDHYQNMKKLTESPPKSPVEFHVYTGVGANFNVNNLRTGPTTRIHLPSFTSTSLDPRTAASFAATKTADGLKLKPYSEMIRLRVGAGSQHGVYHGNNYGPIDGYEDEFILKPKTNIRLIGEPRVLKPRTSRVMMIHDAEIEDHR